MVKIYSGISDFGKFSTPCKNDQFLLECRIVEPLGDPMDHTLLVIYDVDSLRDFRALGVLPPLQQLKNVRAMKFEGIEVLTTSFLLLYPTNVRDYDTSQIDIVHSPLNKYISPLGDFLLLSFLIFVT